MYQEKGFWKRIVLSHYYFRRSGFYWMVFKNISTLIIIIGALIGAFLILDKYVVDFEEVFSNFVESLPVPGVFIVFFISESLLGLIPPDLFIIWSEHLEFPWLGLSLLAVLSYGGGIISYGLGKQIRKNQRINSYVERKFKDNIRNVKRWGSLFVVVAALLPLPYSPVSLIAGMLHYPFSRYVLFGLTRIARFYIYAFALFKLI